MNTKRTKIRVLVLGAILTALVIVLQLMGAFVRLGMFSISLVLVPIVIGAAVGGARLGAWLGFVFGAAVLASGDAAAFLAIDIPGTIITVLLKGVLCGLLAGVAYKAFEKYNRTFAVAVSAVVCPIVNTGVFILGCGVFFMDTIRVWTETQGFGGDVVRYILLFLVGGNFLVELGTNIVLSPVIVRLLRIGVYRGK